MNPFLPTDSRALRLLQNAQKKSFPHAVILAGAAISASNDFAAYLAHTLLCKENNPPCGNCGACIRSAAGTHPDLTIVSKDGSIGVAVVRELITKLSRRPVEGAYKVAVIQNADVMTVQAQNAFLKTLEEPQGNCVFILTTVNEHALLPTIRSRAFVLRMSMPGREQIAGYLTRDFMLTQEQAALFAQVSDGDIGFAVKLCGDVLPKLRQEAFGHITKLCETGSEAFPGVSDFFIKNKAELNDLLFIAASAFRDALALRLGGNIINADHKDAIVILAKSFTMKTLQYIIDETLTIKKRLSQNVTPSAVLDAFILSIVQGKRTSSGM